MSTSPRSDDSAATRAALQRQRALKVGARVCILRKDLGSKWAARRNHNGRIVRIDGGYIDVRPMWWPRGRPPFELYECEIEVLP